MRKLFLVACKCKQDNLDYGGFHASAITAVVLKLKQDICFAIIPSDGAAIVYENSSNAIMPDIEICTMHQHYNILFKP